MHKLVPPVWYICDKKQYPIDISSSGVCLAAREMKFGFYRTYIPFNSWTKEWVTFFIPREPSEATGWMTSGTSGAGMVTAFAGSWTGDWKFFLLFMLMCTFSISKVKVCTYIISWMWARMHVLCMFAWMYVLCMFAWMCVYIVCSVCVICLCARLYLSVCSARIYVRM